MTFPVLCLAGYQAVIMRPTEPMEKQDVLNKTFLLGEDRSSAVY